MKRKHKYTREESTLLQEIIRTYRYPDGTLNGIAVFISTLALVLLLIFGHFTINGIKQLAGLNKVSASELTLSEIEDYITESYLDSISDYTNGRISKEAAKQRILKHISETINSSDAFTIEQKQLLQEEITKYLDTIDIDQYLQDSEVINNINKKFEKYEADNSATLELLKKSLLLEINSNKTYTDKELAVLKDLLDKLSKLELSHFNTLNQYIEEANKKIDNNYDSFITKIYKGIPIWSSKDTYKKNDYVFYNDTLYKNISGAFTNKTPAKDKDNWAEASITSVISNNYKELSDKIDELDKKSSSKIDDLDNKTNTKIDDLDNKTNTNLVDLHAKLINIINNNKALTDEECKLLLQLINENATTSGEEIEKLKDRINALEDKSQATEKPSYTPGLNKNAEFDFAYKNGVYGYWINEVFYPF